MQIEAIRAAGLPVSPNELNKWYEAVPDAENQALLILEAARSRTGLELTERYFARSSEDAPLDPEMNRTLRNYLTANERTLALLHRAAQLTRGRYPVDLSEGTETRLPHLVEIKRLARLLRAEVIQESHTDDLEGAVRSLDAGMALASSLRDEPLLISNLVRMFCVMQALDGMERVASEHQMTERELVLLANRLEEAEADGLRGLFRGLVGDRVMGMTSFESPFSETRRIRGSVSFPDVGSGASEMLAVHAYRASGVRERDLTIYLETMNGFIQSVREPFPDALSRFEQTGADMSFRFSQGVNRFVPLISRGLLVPMELAGLKEANFCVRLRCEQVAIAIERFRLEHDGALPDSLAQLAPRYLKKIPIAPFDGSDLKYERLAGKGYRVFSPAAASANRTYLSQNAEDLGVSIFR